MLDEYQRKAEAINNDPERAERLMGLAGIALTIDTNRGFEDMKLAIAEFNRAGFAPELEKYQASNGGNQVSGVGVNIGVGTLLNGWGMHSFNLRLFGEADFDRALTLAQHFQMREASALAQLDFCRGALMVLRRQQPKKQGAPVKQ
jgi:hypothetical protein